MRIMKNTKVLAYVTFAVALLASVLGWWYPQVCMGLAAAAALFALATALSVKE